MKETDTVKQRHLSMGRTGNLTTKSTVMPYLEIYGSPEQQQQQSHRLCKASKPSIAHAKSTRSPRPKRKRQAAKADAMAPTEQSPT